VSAIALWSLSVLIAQLAGRCISIPVQCIGLTVLSAVPVAPMHW